MLVWSLFWGIVAAVGAIIAYFVFVFPIVKELSEVNEHLQVISTQLQNIEDSLEDE